MRVPILMFHRVGLSTAAEPAVTRALTVAPRAFAAETEWLRRAGFHAVSLAQVYDALERGASLPSKPIAITFDDGYRDVLWNAAPLLGPAQARYELAASKRTLERHLRRTIWWFAYPGGRVNAPVARLVRAAGYRLALTTRPGDLQRAAVPLLLHRDAVYSWTGLRGLAALVAG